LTTRIEVDTTVYPEGGGQRRIEILSKDGGSHAEHPSTLSQVGSRFSVLEEQKGKRVLVGEFEQLHAAPSGYGFHLKSLERSTDPMIALKITDWGLFQVYSYAEVVRDVVTVEDSHAAIREGCAVLVELVDRTLQSVLDSEVYAGSQLRTDLHGALKKSLSEWSIRFWDEIPSLAGISEQELLDRWLPRMLPRLADLGLQFSAEDVSVALMADPDHPQSLRCRAVLQDWLEAKMEPLESGSGGDSSETPRRRVSVDLDAILFDGGFEAAFEAAALERFGTAENIESWMEGLQDRVSGLFGPRLWALGGDQFTVVQRVKMPGQLLRTNGVIGEQGVSFFEFTQDAIYPEGAGLQCSSVLWNLGMVAGLPSTTMRPTNEHAVHFMNLCSLNGTSIPNPRLVDLVTKCARGATLEPLRSELKGGPSPDGVKQAARALLNWLEGEED